MMQYINQTFKMSHDEKQYWDIEKSLPLFILNLFYLEDLKCNPVSYEYCALEFCNRCNFLFKTIFKFFNELHCFKIGEMIFHYREFSTLMNIYKHSFHNCTADNQFQWFSYAVDYKVFWFFFLVLLKFLCFLFFFFSFKIK